MYGDRCGRGCGDILNRPPDRRHIDASVHTRHLYTYINGMYIITIITSIIIISVAFIFCFHLLSIFFFFYSYYFSNRVRQDPTCKRAYRSDGCPHSYALALGRVHVAGRSVRAHFPSSSSSSSDCSRTITIIIYKMVIMRDDTRKTVTYII